MLLNIDQCDITEIKKVVRDSWIGISSAHISEAVAAGLGFETTCALVAAFDGQHCLLSHISEVGFIGRLTDLCNIEVTGSPLLAALVRGAPRALLGQTHDEGILAATVQAIAAERKRMVKRGDEGEATAFSLSIAHQGGNEFSAEVVFCEDYRKIVMIHDGCDNDTVAGLFDADLDAIEVMLEAYDHDWITNYTNPEDETLIQGKPLLDPGIVAFGRTAKVWREAVAILHFDCIGDLDHREVIEIDEAMFRQIEDALHAMGSWIGNAAAIDVIIDHAQRVSSIEENGPNSHEIAVRFPS